MPVRPDPQTDVLADWRTRTNILNQSHSVISVQVACGSNSARDLVSFFKIPSEYDNHKQFNKLASERKSLDKPFKKG
ncbi:hypothetical protein NQ317_009365 [Molorchus minor]|uniref:Uncharacterized protein n=1 Tax=Molorchus minor TaxID=1323400 RepID=A0ABQ9JQ75_9CUCU|nr:hypothetical protein NQ317_009365 [Molorchus minor]